jgi:hypothetical protein
LAKTEENKKALDEFMANYFRVESKQGIIGNSNLIDGIIVLWGVLSCLDIFCSQILDINDKQSANQNSWVRNINNIKVLEKAMVGVLSNLPPEEDITALKWLFNEYLNSTIDIKPQGFGSKPTIKKEKPVDYQAKIKGLKNFLTEFTNLENHKFIMDNVFNELFEIITSLNVINMTLEDFLRLHLFHGSVKIEPPLPINLTEMVNKHRINSTSLENILNIQTTHFWLLESPELLDKIGMSELQPFLDEIKKIIKRAQEIYQSLASNNVKNIETATNERLSIQITLRLLEVYIALAKIINNSNPNMSVNFRNTANRNIPMSYIAKLTITNAEEYEKYLD